MTPAEHQAALDAYNTAQNQLASDRQALENKTATDICDVCTTYDMAGLITELQEILDKTIPGSQFEAALSSTIGVANILATVQVEEDPDPEV